MNLLGRSLLICTTILAVSPVTGFCAGQDSISAAEQADKRVGIDAPGMEETRGIAEEGFIYGLPIVMNYAVQYEFAVDKSSGQFKAPFNEINNACLLYTSDAADE